MEKGLFHELYKRSCELEMGRCPSPALSGFLHGYLSVYSMVRVYPWLEESFGETYEIHERVREIARFIEPLAGNKNLPADVRAGYVVDLMDAYLLYSDMKFVDVALDAAYEILIPKGSDKIVLPCRTPNICRLLCNCYYFTGEDECIVLAKNLVTEALGVSRKFNCEELRDWWRAICFYEDVVGTMELSLEEQISLEEERVRLTTCVKQQKDEIIERFHHVDEDIRFDVEVFNILAKRAFVECNAAYRKWK